jgi:very-short-patch-repair endonuclease
MAPPPAPATEETLQARLDRQARRRASRVPTLTVLCGPVGLGARAWRGWAEGQGRASALLSAPELAPLVRHWVAALAGRRDLRGDALAFLAARTGRPPAELQATLSAHTPHDRDCFWDAATLAPERESAVAVCRWLTRPGAAETAADRLADELDGALAGWDGPWRRVVVALAGLLPPDALPAVMLAPPSPSACTAEWLAPAARVLTELVTHAPTLPAALAVEPACLERYLREAPESHALALVREGVIHLEGLDAGAIGRRLRERGLAVAGLAGPVRRLAADGASEELVAAFAEAAGALTQGESVEAADRARSAAERFLFERLESLPQTAGRFALNTPLDFRFGRADAEVDLLAAELRLAVEVDGYYHFRDPAAYRRDRRKDWELQRRGYLVLRFLADDVVARMEEMLDTVLAAVEHCQALAQPGR